MGMAVSTRAIRLRTIAVPCCIFWRYVAINYCRSFGVVALTVLSRAPWLGKPMACLFLHSLK